jgi:hypothetical protein
MNRTNAKDWTRNSRNDTVTNVSVIVAGMLAIFIAAAGDLTDSSARVSQAASNQNANARTVVAGTHSNAS